MDFVGKVKFIREQKGHFLAPFLGGIMDLCFLCLDYCETQELLFERLLLTEASDDVRLNPDLLQRGQPLVEQYIKMVGESYEDALRKSWYRTCHRHGCFNVMPALQCICGSPVILGRQANPGFRPFDHIYSHFMYTIYPHFLTLYFDAKVCNVIWSYAYESKKMRWERILITKGGFSLEQLRQSSSCYYTGVQKFIEEVDRINPHFLEQIQDPQRDMAICHRLKCFTYRRCTCGSPVYFL